MEKIKAIIFDMDGVISDTQKLHAQGESDLLRKLGINISPEEITRKYAGVRTRDYFNDLLKPTNQDYNLDELMEQKMNALSELAEKSVEEIRGSIALIQTLHKAGLKLAVASASGQIYVRRVIESLGLEDYFEILVSGDMVVHGKPDPEIFLLAASKLEVDPSNCVVIEDGASGMRAAAAANMRCIGLVENKDQSYPTKNLVVSLEEITLEYLSDLS